MAGIKTIAVVRRVDAGWVAAVSFIEAGIAKIDVVSASSENAARQWIIQKADIAGIAEMDIQFMPTNI